MAQREKLAEEQGYEAFETPQHESLASRGVRADEASGNPRRCALVASLSPARKASRHAVSGGPAGRQKSHAIHAFSVGIPHQCTDLLPSLRVRKTQGHRNRRRRREKWLDARRSMLFGARNTADRAPHSHRAPRTDAILGGSPEPHKPEAVQLIADA